MNATLYAHEDRVRLLGRLYGVKPTEPTELDGRLILELPWLTYIAPLPELVAS